MKSTNFSDTKKIPAKLADELKKRNLSNYKIININPAKGRYNLLAVVEDRTPLFIKYNDPTGAGWNTFSKEKEIYHFMEGEKFIPKALHNEEILATVYIKGSCTLREWLLDNDDPQMFSCLIRNIVRQYQLFLRKLNDYSGKELRTLHADKELNVFLGKLLTSGPYGSKIHKMEKIRNKCFHYFLRKKYASRIKLSENTCVIHGDFHLNNILVAEGKTYVIDLENIIRGNAAIELAYWYVQVWVLVCNNKNLLPILEEEIKSIFDMELFDEKEFRMTVRLYQLAILLNRRFHRHEKRAGSKTIISKWLELNSPAAFY